MRVLRYKVLFMRARFWKWICMGEGGWGFWISVDNCFVDDRRMVHNFWRFRFRVNEKYCFILLIRDIYKIFNLKDWLNIRFEIQMGKDPAQNKWKMGYSQNCLYFRLGYQEVQSTAFSTNLTYHVFHLFCAALFLIIHCLQWYYHSIMFDKQIGNEIALHNSVIVLRFLTNFMLLFSAIVSDRYG